MNKMKIPALVLSGLLAGAVLPAVADSSAPAPGTTTPQQSTTPGLRLPITA
ncbi:hypothetical protein [Pseudomonas sp. OHS18]|uniref:hypothetical protein n=1 Tax=Pseudomonas sp. OHS18 TaxID=3399679 RepID=UPI003A890E7E